MMPQESDMALPQYSPHGPSHSPGEKSVVDEEYIEHTPEGTASAGKALFMLLKAFVGTGVIFLPGSFVSGGLVFSICLMIAIAVVCLISFQLLIQTQRTVGGSYDDMGQTLYGPWIRIIILFFLCLSQMGFASSYMIFISENIGLAVDQLSHCTASLDTRDYIWMVLVIIIPITWVRKIARLSWNAIIADTFILFGLVSILYFTSREISVRGTGPNIRMINTSDFALMIGTAVFSFEGIGMVVPIIEGMREPQKFPMVLNCGMIIVAVVFILIGTIGYLAYGDTTQASVVANLPPQPLTVVVQLLYALAIILSAPFILYPALTIIENAIFGDKCSGRRRWVYKWAKNGVRSLVAIVCAAVSYSVGSEGLNKFVALVGSLACMPLCFIFPGMFHFKITSSRWAKAGDIALVLWGFGIMTYTLYININAWIHPIPSIPNPAAICPS